ncbi:MAG TPA: hypothetical protein VFB43_13450 [Terracidiphilus sp.]|nr:hypothetical protein [Terracidiphilus sp.]
MVDYAKLAERARALQDAAAGITSKPEVKEQDPVVFFDSVKAYLVAEMHKANAELGKRGVATLDRSFSPSFSKRFCFTFGTSLLCSVELDVRTYQPPRIKAIISGPPTGGEIGRREYVFNQRAQEPESFRADESAGVIVTGLNAEDTAIDIISSVLSGEFS